ncbi:hypothetical protein FIV07_09255 [Mycobacterium sp. THAF192]|nr:hypothetical protein FIV07_09255 [Mycobacterium sp. THAF192]
MKFVLLSVLSAIATGGIAFAQPANATPPCQTNWELKADGVCRPIYSVPTNGYDPYDPSGQGFLRGLGPDSTWEGQSAQSNDANFLQDVKARFTSSNGGDQKLLQTGHEELSIPVDRRVSGDLRSGLLIAV